jgi:hypothetical protein
MGRNSPDIADDLSTSTICGIDIVANTYGMNVIPGSTENLERRQLDCMPKHVRTGFRGLIIVPAIAEEKNLAPFRELGQAASLVLRNHSIHGIKASVSCPATPRHHLKIKNLREFEGDAYFGLDPLAARTSEDLSVIKSALTYGGAICGGVNAFLTVRRGTDGEIDRAVDLAIQALKANRPYPERLDAPLRRRRELGSIPVPRRSVAAICMAAARRTVPVLSGIPRPPRRLLLVRSCRSSRQSQGRERRVLPPQPRRACPRVSFRKYTRGRLRL